MKVKDPRKRVSKYQVELISPKKDFGQYNTPPKRWGVTGRGEPLAAGASVQEPLAANAGVREPLAAAASVIEPLAATASVQEPLAATQSVQEPLAAAASVQEPLAASAGVLEQLSDIDMKIETVRTNKTWSSPPPVERMTNRYSPYRLPTPLRRKNTTPAPALENITSRLVKLSEEKLAPPPRQHHRQHNSIAAQRHNITTAPRRKTPPRIRSVIVKLSSTTVNQIEKRREEMREEAELLDRVCNDNMGDVEVIDEDELLYSDGEIGN